MDPVGFSAGKQLFVKALTFSLTLISALVVSGCGDESDSGSAQDGSVSGSKAKLIKLDGAVYSLADGYLKRIDISTPANPTVTDELRVPFDAEALTHDGEAIYVASASVLHTYKYNDTTQQLEFIDDSIPRRAVSDPVVSNGEYAYSTVIRSRFTDADGRSSGTGDLYVYEVDAEKNLTEINFLNDIGYVQGLALWDDQLYVCDPNAGLLHMNVSDPMLIETVTQLSFVKCDDILHFGNGHFATVGEQGIYQLKPYDGAKLAVISIYQ